MALPQNISEPVSLCFHQAIWFVFNKGVSRLFGEKLGCPYHHHYQLPSAVGQGRQGAGAHLPQFEQEARRRWGDYRG